LRPLTVCDHRVSAELAFLRTKPQTSAESAILAGIRGLVRRNERRWTKYAGLRYQSCDAQPRTLITRRERPREESERSMVSTSPTGKSSRPKPAAPRSVASTEARQSWPQVDPKLARGAVEWALARTRAALRRHDIAAALLIDPANIRYASGPASGRLKRHRPGPYKPGRHRDLGRSGLFLPGWFQSMPAPTSAPSAVAASKLRGACASPASRRSSSGAT
jgi:hypothetical protein